MLLVLTLARVILHRLSFLDKDAASIFIESTFCISAAPSRSEVCKLTQVGFKTAEFAVLLIHHVHLSHLESRVAYWQISSFTFGTQDVTSHNVRGVSVAEIRTQVFFLFCVFLCVTTAQILSVFRGRTLKSASSPADVSAGGGG